MSVPDELRRYVPRTDLYDSYELISYHMPVEQPPASYSYEIFRKGNKTYAKNGTYGHIEYESTDAATTIQHALNQLSNGGKIFIKAGTYRISSMITVNASSSSMPIIIEGEGLATILNSTVSDSPTIKLYNSNVYPELIIRNLLLQSSTKVANRDGIQINEAHFALIENVKLINFDKAIHIMDSNNVALENLGVTAANYGVYTEYTGTSYADTLIIKRAHISWCSNAGIYLDSANFVHLEDLLFAYNVMSIHAYKDVHQLFVENCFFEGGSDTPEVYLEGISWKYPLRIATFKNCRWSGTANTTDAVQVGYVHRLRFENCRSAGHTNFINSRADATTNERKIEVDWQCKIDDTNIANNLNTLIINNPDFITENSGTATISAGNTSITVNHGLAGTPSKVLVTPIGDPGDRFWVANITNTSFDIVVATAPTVDVDFCWQAKV